MRKPHRWTVAEIAALPEFGEGMGWFYGWTEDGLSEIIPGLGYGRPFWRDVIRHPLRVVRDLWCYRPLPSLNSGSTNTAWPFNATASNTHYPAPPPPEERT